MSNPKVGETWMRRSRFKDREVTILEEVVCPSGGIVYFVSYYSESMGRRSCETVRSAAELYPKPVKLVSYQLMTVTQSGYVKAQYSANNSEVLIGASLSKAPTTKVFIQRTEMTGDKIEVFVEKTL